MWIPTSFEGGMDMWIPSNRKINYTYPRGILAYDISSFTGTLTKGSIVYIREHMYEYDIIDVMDEYGHTIRRCTSDCIETWLDEHDPEDPDDK